ncbi:MAG: hypothetical protein JRI68_11530 [Deltaproteobacteria bacterium]|nr:hypothetical protein [Deltaproteobacteria bacterium]
MTSKVRKWAVDRAAILKRRKLMITAAMSTVTATTVTAQAQICLSFDLPDPPTCAHRENITKANASPWHWLEIGRCYEEQERNLEEALAIYEDFMARTDGQKEFADERRHIKWKIGRIESLLAAERGPSRTTPEPEGGTEPEPSSAPPKDIEVIANPSAEAAPRSGGAASCGCDVVGARPDGGLGVAAVAGLAALAQRRRRRGGR